MVRTALITGANSGIGLACATALSQAGFTICAGARRDDDILALRTRGFHALRIDVEKEEEMAAAVAQVERETGGIDVLVNSAGYGVMGPMEELPLDVLKRQMEVNVFGLLRMSQLVLPGMRRRGRGRIIHIGSVGGLFTAPGAGGYHMSKYAVEALADAMRGEVRGFGIEVALIEPTGVRTPFLDRQIAAMAPDGPDHAYGPFKTALAKNAKALFDPGSRAVAEPEAVAAAVRHAATARRPKTRYPVGAVAHLIPIFRRLTPDRLWDRAMLSQVGVTPGTGERKDRFRPYQAPAPV